MRRFFAVFAFLCLSGPAFSQRSYAPHSVLAEGNWYKIAVREAGVYKISAAMLTQMGIPAGSQVRLFGNGGQMLAEDNAVPRADDLQEVALMIEDGGDGTIDAGDYILFYAPGPHTWQREGSSYRHQVNLYADSSIYFLNISPDGLRIQTAAPAPSPSIFTDTYDYRVFHENNLTNILSSGKEWLGESFGSEHTIPFTLPPLTDAHVRFRAASRSTGSASFEVMGETFYPLPVSGNIFETYATVVEGWIPASAAFSSVTVRYQGSGSAWLDYLEVQGRSPLTIPSSSALLFRDASTVGAVAAFRLSNADGQTQVWDVTDPIRPVKVTTTLNGSTLTFSRNCNVLHEFAAFSASAGLPEPQYIGTVPNQDLHAQGPADMLIITTPELAPEAERLAAWHRSFQQLQVTVTTTGLIYNEFGSGSPDPSAIRDYVKMHYDRHGLRYLLLFGDASYNYKANLLQVPTWQSDASLHGINTHMSDDFFGLLDDNDNINILQPASLLDVAIGRLPVKGPAEAAAVVNKIMRYHSPAGFGPWRSEMTFVADDEDSNLHLEDAETVSNIIFNEQPQYNIRKIYLDAYPQASASGGSRYPAVNEAIDNRMFNGTLVWNYTGHGSFSRLAEEAVLDETSLDNWRNANKLPLMITATCDFAPFDNPAFESLGEKLLLREDGGAIALMTTTRSVFAYANLVLNANYLRLAFQPGNGGRLPTLGEGAMQAKNFTYSTFADIVNNRKFQLLGDPALPLAYPQWRVYTDSVNGQPAGTLDTLNALGRYTLKGSVRDGNGQIRGDYNGTVYITVFDKPVNRRTLGNDPGSSPAVYAQQDAVLFKGTDTVQHGRFTSTFIIPKDILQIDGTGKIAYYTFNEETDGSGVHSNITVAGTADDIAEDRQGPDIRAWMNDESFVSGGLTNEEPLLLVSLEDEHGINTSGNGIGHDIVAVLDDSTRFYVLNEFYTATPGDFRKGYIRFPMAGLTPGRHTLTIRAWDTYNNSSTINITFTVVPKSALEAENVYNYPNPVRSGTRFVFSHNQQGDDLDVDILIFAASGRKVRTISSTINTTAGRYDGVLWNGKADAGTKLTPGIYFYQVIVKDKRNKQKVFGGKLILL